MSITIKDIMKLPCMRNAEIVAGKAGLENVVTAVSVMEYSSYSDEQDKVFSEDNYEGSDIVISAFSSIAGDNEKILAQIVNSSEIGEAGVIIYYFDLFIKSLDQKIIDFANDAGFPIIVMPRDQYQLRYSQAIAEISELIAEDRHKTDNFAASLMETFVSIPKNQQNTTTLLKLLSNYLHLTLILTERDWKIRTFAGWPTAPEREIEGILDRISEGSFEGSYEVVSFDDIPGSGVKLVVTGSGELKRSTIDQISDVIRLYLKMSAGEPSESIGMAQLIRAIIGDEPVKMRKLAGNLGIDAGKIRNMIIFREAHIGLPSGDMMFREIRDLLSKYCHDYVADIYSGDIVVFLDDGLSSQWLPALRMLRDKMAEKGMAPVCVYARNLADTSEVREAYLNVSAHLEDARNLYRNSSIISYNEILYVAECKEIISRGEDAIKKELEPLKYLNLGDNEPEQDLTETLASFYFDSGMSVTETAANLYIHVNTVKYRLRKISEVIGCRVTDMPEMLGLYRALAIKRLIQS